jgi:uncharacterized hydrophobic protein (TIGR00271 family)
MDDLGVPAAIPWWRAQPADVERVAGGLLLTEGGGRRRKQSAFWVLIVLAAVIASAGIIADSTATVIGAMIVAPLMTPILGTALAVVLARRRLVLVNLALVVAGAASVVAIGFLLGLSAHARLLAETNAQVAARVSPRLIDLVAALATGAVGAFAVVRSDVSDTLPGVAIAISLVPPLAVVGLSLESGAPEQAAGALLLFGTNVGAIVATGTVVFLVLGVREAARAARVDLGRLRAGTLLPVLASVALLAVPLGVGSAVVVEQELVLARATPAATAWATAQGWQVSDITVRGGVLRVVALGPPPTIGEAGLRDALDAAGLAAVPARVTLVLGGSRDVPVR